MHARRWWCRRQVLDIDDLAAQAQRLATAIQNGDLAEKRMTDAMSTIPLS